MYLKNKEELKDQPDISKFFQLIALVWFGLVNDLMAFFSLLAKIEYIDGSQNIDAIFRMVYNKLKSYQ